MKRRTIGTTCAGLLIAFAGAQIPAGAIVRAPGNEQTDPAAVLPGAKTYNEQCAGCHGPRGKGAEGPSLDDQFWVHGRTDADIAKSIREGFPPKMVPFDLPAAQINDLVAYLRAIYSPSLNLDRSVLPVPAGIIHSEAADFRIEKVAQLKEPYGFVFLPDGRALITEVSGTIRILENGKLLPQVVEGIPVAKPGTGQSGRRILNIVLHPDYARNGWIYLTVADDTPLRTGARPGAGILMKVVRGKIRDGRWNDHQVLFEAFTGEASTARMAFDRDGYLFMTLGYSGNSYFGPDEDAPSLDLSDANGKILRMHDDGRPPADNPFVNVEGALKQVWSYGHRQSLGLTFDASGTLWESENGARGGDEMNIIRKGANYGWPIVTWGHRYDSMPRRAVPEMDGVEQPVVSWVPSPAVSAAIFYEGNAFPRWKGNLFVGALKNRALYRIVIKDGRQVLQEEVLRGIDRVRDVGVGPDEYLYLLTDGGLFLRLVPAK